MPTQAQADNKPADGLVRIVFRGPGEMIEGIEVCIAKWFGDGPDKGKTFTFIVGEPVYVTPQLVKWAMEQNSRGCKTVEEARDYQMRIFEIVEGGEG